jgi:hypothetical protein
MSDNPYAPPSADLGAERGGRQPLGGRGDFDIGECLSDAWANTWANFPLWLGVGLVFIAAAAVSVVSVIGIVLVLPVLTWGVTYFGLRMHDGRAEFGDLFAGFSQYGSALTGMLGCIVLIMLVGIVGQSVQLVGDFSGNETLSIVGGFITVAFAIFVTPRLTFAYFFVVEGVPPAESLSRAWEVTGPTKWKIVALVFIGIAVMVAGMLALVVGLIPAAQVIYLMWISAYRQTVGAGATG